ncbi:hypothetical protein [Streptomyces sp. NPDC017260]|uniref:hypothetical protein n=1 Tax=unclassified Streptomyces TaxID=2593676 RepID=UPI0037987EBC
MTMPRKHYRTFAEILRHAYECFPESREALDYLSGEMAGVYAEDNRAFRRQKFYDAARPETPA